MKLTAAPMAILLSPERQLFLIVRGAGFVQVGRTADHTGRRGIGESGSRRVPIAMILIRSQPSSGHIFLPPAGLLPRAAR